MAMKLSIIGSCEQQKRQPNLRRAVDAQQIVAADV